MARNPLVSSYLLVGNLHCSCRAAMAIPCSVSCTDLTGTSRKSAVLCLLSADWDAWLHGAREHAEGLIMVSPAEMLDYRPADRGNDAQLPL